MHFTPWPRWLRIVSTATVVLPVLRSPMISSRWPRPTGVMASMAMMPDWIGVFTGWRAPPPGAGGFAGPGRVGDARPLPRDRRAQRIAPPADHGVADRHRQQFAGRADLVALD